jgi:hypothetical protein
LCDRGPSPHCEGVKDVVFITYVFCVPRCEVQTVLGFPVPA